MTNPAKRSMPRNRSALTGMPATVTAPCPPNSHWLSMRLRTLPSSVRLFAFVEFAKSAELGRFTEQAIEAIKHEYAVNAARKARTDMDLNPVCSAEIAKSGRLIRSKCTVVESCWSLSQLDNFSREDLTATQLDGLRDTTAYAYLQQQDGRVVCRETDAVVAMAILLSANAVDVDILSERLATAVLASCDEPNHVADFVMAVISRLRQEGIVEDVKMCLDAPDASQFK